MSTKIQKLGTDVLIVGGGGAGAMAAIKAMAEGVDVLVATKGPFPSGNTSIAKGGFSAALGHADSRDNINIHYKDVLKAGRGLNNQIVTKTWVSGIIDIAKELDTWGVDLAREDGKLAQRFARGGHSFPRQVFHKTSPGKSIIKCLRNKSGEAGVKILEHTIVGGLIKNNDKLIGAWGIDLSTAALLFISSKAVILATGGIGHLFPVTDNIEAITGEGYALAFRAGAELIDMEMTHFLPALCHPRGLKVGHVVERTIVAAINDGKARLYNGLGERFMKKYFPDSGETGKSGEEITRSIGTEICEGRSGIHGGVYLDVSDLPDDMHHSLFSDMRNLFRNAGIDLHYQPIEIAPGPHDFLGGIRIDENTATNIPGLFAAGEAAGGSHGATRMAGSSLADALVFGAIAGRSAARYSKTLKNKVPISKDQQDTVHNKINNLLSGKEGISPSEIKKHIQDITHQHLNIVRMENGLNEAMEKLTNIGHDMLPRMKVISEDSGRLGAKLGQAIEAEGQLELARIISTAAGCRKESRSGHYGGHIRQDYPDQNDEQWQRNIVIRIDDRGEISYRTAQQVKEE